ncbi:hypothetical protein [Nonomuraea helvata]|uniref:Uncharacterized protein n=1 Tax=Nonomuraea helvata TaxID=37484 RepID=A0ABV5S7F1_9ACTN
MARSSHTVAQVWRSDDLSPLPDQAGVREEGYAARRSLVQLRCVVRARLEAERVLPNWWGE